MHMENGSWKWLRQFPGHLTSKTECSAREEDNDDDCSLFFFDIWSLIGLDRHPLCCCCSALSLKSFWKEISNLHLTLQRLLPSDKNRKVANFCELDRFWNGGRCDFEVWGGLLKMPSVIWHLFSYANCPIITSLTFFGHLNFWCAASRSFAIQQFNC